MNQPVPIDRDARSELVQGVIFDGTPSQVINLPVFIKGVVAAGIVIGAYVYAMMRWPVPWFVPALALLLIGTGGVVTYLRTAFTEIVIDTARITVRQGILSRRVQSLELFRIQDVTSLQLAGCGHWLGIAPRPSPCSDNATNCLPLSWWHAVKRRSL